jgi:predicted  nucleic acid-binding Zn-ribbon protein
MTAPLSAQRVFNINELVTWLDEFMPRKDGVLEEVIACLKDYSAMRAENERLRAEFSTLKKAYDDECAWRGRGYRDLLTRAEKSEAENERLREDFEYKNEQLGSAIIRAEKGEARVKELEAEIEQLRK